jgi:hypothetical protein
MANHARQVSLPPPATATPTTPHPTIVGVAWFRSPDGWVAGRIRTNDPSIFVETSPPTLKSLAMDTMRHGVVMAWEADS